MTEIKKPAAAPVPKGAIPIRHVRFRADGNQRGFIIARPNEALDQVAAREPNKPGGYDIWLTADRVTFRFDYYDGGQFSRAKHIPAHNVFSYEESDQGV